MPSASAVDGAHDHEPLSEAVAVQTAVPSALTVTVASCSLVPDTVAKPRRLARRAHRSNQAGGPQSAAINPGA